MIAQTQTQTQTGRWRILMLLAAIAFVAASWLSSAERREDLAYNLDGLWLQITDQDGYSIDLDSLSPTDQITFWQSRIQGDGDYLNRTKLAGAYYLHARQDDAGEAFPEAQRVLEDALAANPNYQPAQSLMGAVLISQHDFPGALAQAEALLAADPNNLQALATSGDAALELGMYDRAATVYADLTGRLPGPATDSRITRLAWLQGEPERALATLQAAAGKAELEDYGAADQAWYQFQVGELYYNSGDLDSAEQQYERAIDLSPEFALAHEGIIKIEAARGDWQAAVDQYEPLIANQTHLDISTTLGDLYTLLGDEASAARHYQTVLDNSELTGDELRLNGREIALFLADREVDLERAWAYAQADFENRQDIYAYDTMAWVLYKMGRVDEAAELTPLALAQNTPDAKLFYHAGLIALANGQTAEGQTWLQQALDTNPYFNLLEAQHAGDLLAGLSN